MAHNSIKETSPHVRELSVKFNVRFAGSRGYFCLLELSRIYFDDIMFVLEKDFMRLMLRERSDICSNDDFPPNGSSRVSVVYFHQKHYSHDTVIIVVYVIHGKTR